MADNTFVSAMVQVGMTLWVPLLLVALVIAAAGAALLLVWKRKGWACLEVFHVATMGGGTLACLLAGAGVSRADDGLNSMIGGFAQTMQTDFLGIIGVIGPYAIKIAMVLGGVLLVVGLIRFLSNKLAG